MVDTIAANACASAYKKDAALYVGNLLVMVLRVMERLEICGLGGGRAIAGNATDASLDDTVGGGFLVGLLWEKRLLLEE